MTERIMRSLLLCATGALVGAYLGVGCVTPHPNHCMMHGGDAACVERGAGRYCSECRPENDGCVDAMPAEGCHVPAPVEEGSSVGIESTSGEATTHTPPNGTSTGGTTGEVECTEHAGCGGDTPFCAGNVCVGCADADDGHAACASRFPETPLCVEGSCVQCTAEAQEVCAATPETPVCDETTHTCACTDHDQCGGAACNFFTGRCLPPDAVAHVGPGFEFATLGAAVGSFGSGAEGTIVVHGGNYSESVTVDGGRALAFLRAEVEGEGQAIWFGELGVGRQLTVTDATVLLHRLELSENAQQYAPAVLVGSGGHAWIDRSRIIRNDDGGIRAEGGAEVVLRNGFVGDDDSGMRAFVVDGATARVLYSTLAAGGGSSRALFCVSPMEVTVRNSIAMVLDHDVAIECDDAEVMFTAAPSTVSGFGNQAVGIRNAGNAGVWFENYQSGDFRLHNQGPAIFGDIAEWRTGDPRTDIDGKLRPNANLAQDFAGADVP